MTIDPVADPEKKFVRVVLPWLFAAGALVLYVVTLNHWVSLNSLNQIGRASGWLWQPELYAPLYWVVTYPFRWLPAPIIPVALNAFSAVCACLTLALLARSVTLLPHDRTHEQRIREQGPFSLLSIGPAWVPPLIAILVCGLQLTFWENATAASGEMLDLLFFAYVIRCLLEFRIDEREAWLMRAALAYGLAITNNWAMIGFFPAFLGALIWIRGLAFFNIRFLGRQAICGLTGLTLYLLLPLAQTFSDIGTVPFWSALRANLAAQKSVLTLLFNKQVLFTGDSPLWVLGLFSLLPILMIGIRWSSYFGDPSRLGVVIATLILHLAHGALLVLCLWVALDSQLSPRYLIPGLPLLTFYYLSALSVGYFAGYFLLVFGAKADRQRRPVYQRLFQTFILCIVWLLILAAPAALIKRNLPQIRATNGPILREYTSLLTRQLPEAGAIVLCDPDNGPNVPRRLLLAQSLATQNGKERQCLFVDTGSLKWPPYHRFLRKQYGRRWPVDIPKQRQQPFDPFALLALVNELSKTNVLYYLHPSFGYYFEAFYPEPHGLVYQLVSYPTNVLVAPLLTKERIAENEQFWAKADESPIRALLPLVTPTTRALASSGVEGLFKRMQLASEPNRDASVLAGFYSRALNCWGAELQRNGRLPEAAAHFQRAQDLNRNNVVAQINLECNKNLQAGRKSSVQLTKAVEDAFGEKYRNWDQVLAENGPFDEPSFCYEQGRVYVRNGNYRQAAEEFDRVRTLAPDHLPARLWLAQLYVTGRLPDRALEILEEIRGHADTLPVHYTNRLEMLSIEASALLAKKDLAGAEAAVKKAITKYPKDQELLDTATTVYMNYGKYSNAIHTIDQLLSFMPENMNALVNKGYSALQLNAFELAIDPLSQVLAMETNKNDVHYSALLNRAIAYLRSGKLDEAQRDYDKLQQAFPTAYKIYFGLQEIAYRKHDTNAAVRNCELYLANAPTNTTEAQTIRDRVKELKPPKL